MKFIMFKGYKYSYFFHLFLIFELTSACDNLLKCFGYILNKIVNIVKRCWEFNIN